MSDLDHALEEGALEVLALVRVVGLPLEATQTLDLCVRVGWQASIAALVQLVTVHQLLHRDAIRILYMPYVKLYMHASFEKLNKKRTIGAVCAQIIYDRIWSHPAYYLMSMRICISCK